jgi:hypothetical protein
MLLLLLCITHKEVPMKYGFTKYNAVRYYKYVVDTLEENETS